MLALATVIVFFIAYALIAAEKFNRVAVATGAAAVMILIGATSSDDIFYDHATGIDWNVIFLLLGMMLIVGVIHKTGAFEFLAIHAIRLAKGNPKVTFVYIVLLVALASAVLDNVTTVMLVVPMTLVLAQKLKVSPVPFILGEVFASNIGGAATLVGDPPNIIIGSKAGLGFNEFLVHMAPIAALAMVAAIPLMLLLFRRTLRNSAADRSAAMDLNPREYLRDIPLLVKSVGVLVAVIIGFLLHSVVHLEPSLVAMMGAGFLILISGLKPEEFARDVEWGTLVFFAGLFIMVGALVNVGALGAFADFLKSALGTNLTVITTTVVVVSGILSGIVDNIPYVASMVPVISDLAASLKLEPGNNVLWWALAVGADFGGNMTLVGASANLVAVGLAKKAGVDITFWQFAKYGFPVTVVTIAVTLPYLVVRYTL
ncbi:Na+/H+ antiporter NhaD/arsenite permease-like protein [Microbacteriaceae bacterium MWH-Ta3]|nr:Na+/H+ antiporter NhaD/arsenite permease-like protein [Microbacteriaceae bacterium MWH-Ta3]